MTHDEKVAAVAGVDWFHQFDFGDGIRSAGRAENEPCFQALSLPEDMRGKTVLDIGAFDGYHSFECAKRGARVLATDAWCWQDKPFDFPSNRTFGTQAGFKLARELLNLRVRDMYCWPHQITPALLGKHDVVLLLGVIYHLQNMLQGIQCAWEVTNDVLIVESYVDQRYGEDKPYAVFYPGSEINNDDTTWWGPNIACIKAMLGVLNPTPANIVLTSQWSPGPGTSHLSPPRVIFKAYRNAKTAF